MIVNDGAGALPNEQKDFASDSPEEPWNPWPGYAESSQQSREVSSADSSGLDPWTPSKPNFDKRQWDGGMQISGTPDPFACQEPGLWTSKVQDGPEEHQEHAGNVLGHQDTWTPKAGKQEADRPQTLDLSSSATGNPFGSKDQDHSTTFKEQSSSPFHDDISSPFHPQHSIAFSSHEPSTSQSSSSSQFNTFQNPSDPWSPSVTPDGSGLVLSKGDRSSNPFSLLQESSNPFLKDHHLSSGKLEERQSEDPSKIPDIPKFEEHKIDPEFSDKEGASTSAIMDGVAADHHVMSNGTDTLDVADHDDLFDMSGNAADHTQTDDEFENNERLMQEEEEDHKSFIEVEDIFEDENNLIDAADTDPIKTDREDKEEVEDIFKDDADVSHDYEPIVKTEVTEREPITIEITHADTERSEPELDLENLKEEVDEQAEADLDADLPFPDMPRKSDISLDWEASVGEVKPPSPTPPAEVETTAIVTSPAPFPEQEEVEEIDEGEVAKFVENILINSVKEVSSLEPEQESESQIENDVVDLQVSEPVFGAPETTVESDNVLSPEERHEKVPVDVVSEPAEKEDLLISMEALASEHADIGGLVKDNKSDDRAAEIEPAAPVSSVEVTEEVEEPVKESPEPETLPSIENEVKSTMPELSLEPKKETNVGTKNMDSSENRTRKMSVPRPRDVRKDLSETRPSFFGSNSSAPKPFMSNTLPRVSVLPRISTTYQRKSPTSPTSLSGDYSSSSYDKESEELPTVAKPDLSKDDSQVINELDTIELPHIESLSKPPATASTAAPVKTEESVVPVKETNVEAGPMAPVFASNRAAKDPIVLDGTSPEEIEAIFAKDPEPEPAKKSMGKNDVIASTRVRKISRTTWKGQEEFQKSVEKTSITLDEPQAASLKRYEERKKQRYGAFAGKGRTREDSTSEAESEGSQSSLTHTGPKMPDVVQSGGTSNNGHPESEIVQPKLNMKSVRSLWEQKAAEVEQRRRSLQTKRRPISQGESRRPLNSKNIHKSSDTIENLDDSIEGSTTYSYDGISDDGSTKRESLIERDIRLQKERDLQVSKERERLRSESTSSRDESQQSETSESQDDQVVDIVRDTEMRRDSDDGRSSPSQSSGYTSGRSTPSTPAADDILKVKTGKSSGKTPELKMSLSPADPDAHSNYKEYQKALKSSKADGKFPKSATFPRNYNREADSSNLSPTNSVGDVPDVIMVDGHKSTSTSSGEKARKASLVQQGIKLSQTLEKKKKVKLEKKPRRSLMELEIAAQREKEEAFRQEQKTRKMSTTKLPDDIQTEKKVSSPTSSSPSSTATSPSTTPQGSPRKASVSGPSAKSVYK